MGTWLKPLVQSLDKDVYRHLIEIPMFTYSLFPQRPEKMRVSHAVGANAVPVIFVHGLGGNRAHFLPMDLYFRLSGRRNTFRVDLSKSVSVHRMAWRLAQYIRKVLRVTQAERVDIVAHSLGGIVVRLALDRYALQDRVKTVVTLGTPHGGTYSARFANSAVSRQLRPNSPLIEKLKNTPWPKEVRGVSFWSQNDVVILPAESAQLRETETIDSSPFTHFGYLSSPRSWEAVRRTLD